MGLIQKPTVVGVGDKANKFHAVNFSYDFFADAVGIVQLGSTTIMGSSFTFDPTTLSQSGLGSIKAMQFSASFGNNNASDLADGSLFIFSPGVGQLITLSPLLGDLANLSLPSKTMSGVLPIVSHSLSNIVVAKAANQASGTLFGQLFVTLFDFQVPPFITTGVGVGLSL